MTELYIKVFGENPEGEYTLAAGSVRNIETQTHLNREIWKLCNVKLYIKHKDSSIDYIEPLPFAILNLHIEDAIQWWEISELEYNSFGESRALENELNDLIFDNWFNICKEYLNEQQGVRKDN